MGMRVRYDVGADADHPWIVERLVNECEGWEFVESFPCQEDAESFAAAGGAVG